MKQRSQRLLREIHRLARCYHWSRRELMNLSLVQRQGYLELIEEELDAQWSAGLGDS